MDAEQINSISRAESPQPSKPVVKAQDESLAKPAPQPKGDAAPQDLDTVSLSTEARQALEGTNAPPSEGAQGQQRNFDVTDNNQVILKIKDQETQQVVKQIPAEEEVRLRQAVQEGVESLNENI